jgi:hypothetical protein
MKIVALTDSEDNDTYRTGEIRESGEGDKYECEE